MSDSVKYIYEKEYIDWGYYDVMYPQTTFTKNITVELKTDAKLVEYFSEFIHFLQDVGFSSSEIKNQMTRFCTYQDEISSRIRQTEEKEVGTAEDSIL